MLREETGLWMPEFEDTTVADKNPSYRNLTLKKVRTTILTIILALQLMVCAASEKMLDRPLMEVFWEGNKNTHINLQTLMTGPKQNKLQQLKEHSMASCPVLM